MSNQHDAFVARKLQELQLEQLVRKRGHLKFELDEVAAVRKLAISIFGPATASAGASIHIDPQNPGVFQVGFFTEPRRPNDPGDARRRRQVVFRGRTHAELVEQITTWKAHQ